jgi:hypothetical protein
VAGDSEVSFLQIDVVNRFINSDEAFHHTTALGATTPKNTNPPATTSRLTTHVGPKDGTMCIHTPIPRSTPVTIAATEPNRKGIKSSRRMRSYIEHPVSVNPARTHIPVTMASACCTFHSPATAHPRRVSWPPSAHGSADSLCETRPATLLMVRFAGLLLGKFGDYVMAQIAEAPSRHLRRSRQLSPSAARISASALSQSSRS